MNILFYEFGFMGFIFFVFVLLKSLEYLDLSLNFFFGVILSEFVNF